MLSLLIGSEVQRISQAEIEQIRRKLEIHIALADVYGAANDAMQRKMSGYKPARFEGEDYGLIRDDCIPF